MLPRARLSVAFAAARVLRVCGSAAGSSWSSLARRVIVGLAPSEKTVRLALFKSHRLSYGYG